MRKGLFLVLEGVEGAGKSTQARLLSDWFLSLNVPHILAREPGGTPVGEAIREVVLDRGRLTMPAETELFLILGARAAFTRDLVLPALREGKVVLADRFDMSTFAYQGYGRGLDLEQLKQSNRLATGGLVPDLYLLLDLPVALGLERKGGVEEGDRIEREGSTFLSRVAEGYRTLAQQMASARLVPASGTQEEVQTSLREVLRGRFPETFPAGGV
ncbi:MAG: dTMP kinase [Gemmatimonadota bacterium]